MEVPIFFMSRCLTTLSLPPFTPIKLCVPWERQEDKWMQRERRDTFTSQFWHGSADSVVHVGLKCQLQMSIRAYHYKTAFCWSQSPLSFETAELCPNWQQKLILPQSWQESLCCEYVLMPEVASRTELRRSTVGINFFLTKIRADSDVSVES